MSKYEHPKSEIIISGYIKTVINIYVTKDIIDIILLFHNHYYLFDTFNVDGECIQNESKMIDVNNDTIFS